MTTPATSTTTTLDVFISCQGLKDKDILSKSDPQVGVFESGNAKSPHWSLVGKTEQIKDNLNPKFATSISVIFNFEEMKYLKFKVMDVDSDHDGFESGEFLGEVVCPVHKIVGARGQQVTVDLLINGKPSGKLTARIEEKVEMAEKQHFMSKISASNLVLSSSCCLCSLSPMLEVSRILENNELQVVYRSSAKSGNSANWGMIDITLQKLCNGDNLRPVLFEVSHSEGSGKTLIGECEVSLDGILKSGGSFRLQNPKEKGKDVGSLKFENAQIQLFPTFVDYIAGGCEINLACAVDFTGSNGDPRTPRSLHYQFPDGRLNEYEAALTAVGEILLHYDKDKLVPMYGFGATGSHLGYGVNHCFAMNGAEHNPEVYDLDGMFNTYKESIRKVNFSGPTYFGPLLRRAVQNCYGLAEGPGQKYSILMILTDGAIHDYDLTVANLVEGSKLPLSVIIVGVGQADFDTMEDLDCDRGVLRDQYGNNAQRDIVQFVPFRECSRSIDLLRKKVLAEVPKQLTGYFAMRGIPPNPKVVAFEDPAKQLQVF